MNLNQQSAWRNTEIFILISYNGNFLLITSLLLLDIKSVCVWLTLSSSSLCCVEAAVLRSVTLESSSSSCPSASEEVAEEERFKHIMRMNTMKRKNTMTTVRSVIKPWRAKCLSWENWIAPSSCCWGLRDGGDMAEAELVTVAPLILNRLHIPYMLSSSSLKLWLFFMPQKVGLFSFLALLLRVRKKTFAYLASKRWFVFFVHSCIDFI